MPETLRRGLAPIGVALGLAAVLVAGAPAAAPASAPAVEPPTANVGRSPALRSFPPEAGLLFQARPTLFGLDARERAVVEVAGKVVVVETDGASQAPSSAAAVVERLRPVALKCAAVNGRYGPDTVCRARLAPHGLELRGPAAPGACAVVVAALDAPGTAVLAGASVYYALLVQAQVTADGSRWAAVWRGTPMEGETTLYGVLAGTIPGLRARLAHERGRTRLRRGDAAGALAALQRAHDLTPARAIAVDLARAHARMGHPDAAVAALRPHLADAPLPTFALVAAERDLDALRPRLRALLPATAAAPAPARWGRGFVLGASADGRYLALRRHVYEDCKGDHHDTLEIVAAARPHDRVAAFEVLHRTVEGARDGGLRVARARTAAADDILAAFGFTPLPLREARAVSSAPDEKQRFRFAGERLGVVSAPASSIARVIRERRVVAEVRLAGARWQHGDGTVSDVAFDAAQRRLFIRWDEAPAGCCVGPVPPIHDQISVIPLPP